MSSPEMPDLPGRESYRRMPRSYEREGGYIFPQITLEDRGDAIVATQDLTTVLHEMYRELREKGDEEIRQRLIEAGIVVVKPGRTPEAWVVGEMGDCEPDGGWCQAHGGFLPSNRKPPAYCDDVLDIVDKIERYVS